MSEHQYRACRPVCNYRIPVRQQYGSRSGQRALGQLGTNDSSLLRHRCLYRQLCRIRRIGKYLYRSQTTGEGFKPDQKGRLPLYGVRPQRPKAERTRQRAYYSFMTSLKHSLTKRVHAEHIQCLSLLPSVVVRRQRTYPRHTRRLSGSDALAGSQRECSIDRSQ